MMVVGGGNVVNHVTRGIFREGEMSGGNMSEGEMSRGNVLLHSFGRPCL